MSDDLLRRLREIQGQAGLFASAAADRIEELEAENANLLERLDAAIAELTHLKFDWGCNAGRKIKGGKDE